MLTPHQSKIANEIIKDVEELLEVEVWAETMVSLSGPAGVGKTFLTSYLIQYFLNKGHKIRLTTPTHKSLEVAKNMFKKLATTKEIPITTIHNFLNLKLQIDYLTGEQVLKPDLKPTCKSSSCDILFVDESSMISEELFGYIEEAIGKNQVKICIFIGDELQLPPVEGGENPIFKLKNQYKLKEIVRQAKDNPIIQLATSIRNIIENKDYPDLNHFLNNLKNENKITIYKDTKPFFKDYFENKINNKIVAAFTNKRVDLYNLAIRKKLKGNIPYIIKGDFLIFQQAHFDGTKLVHSNNEIVEVKEAIFKENKEMGLAWWYVTDTKNETFEVIDINYKERYKKILELYAAIAKSKEGYDKKIAWTEYYNIKNNFCEVKYTYASTIHKLQGSTYEDVYIDFRELKEFINPGNKDFIYRLIYVAITRASNSIKILI